MINIRETEFREESLALAIEAYRVAYLLPSNEYQSLRLEIVDAAFSVSSSIAKAFIALQNDQFEDELAIALKGIKLISKRLKRIEKTSLLEAKEIKGLQQSLWQEQQELEKLLAASQLVNTAILNPKLERACI